MPRPTDDPKGSHADTCLRLALGGFSLDRLIVGTATDAKCDRLRIVIARYRPGHLRFGTLS